MCNFFGGVKIISILHHETHKQITMFYILKTTTEQTYCPIENNFFDATWEPIDEDRHVLESIMQDDPERFENCKIVEA